MPESNAIFMKGELYINKKTGRSQYCVAGWYCSEKFDGQRAQWDPANKQLVSRYNNIIQIPDWFATYLNDIPYKLDGELFMGYGSWELTGIFRNKTMDSAMKNKDLWKRVSYIIFDIADTELGNYNERRVILEQIKFKHPLVLIDRTLIINSQELDKTYQSILKRGGEGVMLNNPVCCYKNGRTDNILKYKPVIDDQCVLVGYNPGKGRNEGKLGSFVVHPIEDGEPSPCKEFCISGINDTIRSWYKKSHPIGTILNYSCSDYTLSGKPRHPTYLGICRKPVLSSDTMIPNIIEESLLHTEYKAEVLSQCSTSMSLHDHAFQFEPPMINNYAPPGENKKIKVYKINQVKPIYL